MLLAGIFIAYAFAMKATAIMVAMAMGAVLLGAYLHWSAFIAVVFLVFGLFIKQDNLSIADLTYRLGVAPDFCSLATTVFSELRRP